MKSRKNNRNVIVNNYGHIDQHVENHITNSQPNAEQQQDNGPRIVRSNIRLVNKKGNKIDFIRVFIALYATHMFERADGKPLTKKEFFITLGDIFGIDLSNYCNDLSRSLSDSTSLEKHLSIFNILKEVMIGIFNSR